MSEMVPRGVLILGMLIAFGYGVLVGIVLLFVRANDDDTDSEG